MYYVYMVMNSADNLYIGVSKDPQKRLREHNSQRGAEFTKNATNYKIVFTEEYPNFIEARKREIQLKKWRREKKLALISRFQQGLPTYD